MRAFWLVCWLCVGLVLAAKQSQVQDKEVMITLQTSDGHQLQITNQTAQLSGLLRGVLEFAHDQVDEPIPLPNVDLESLKKVNAFSSFYVQHPTISTRQGLGAELIQFDQEQEQFNSAFFNKVSLDVLFKLIMVSDYLDHAILLRAATQAVAKMMEGRTTEEMRIMFNIENDFTPQEEQQLAKESEWARALPVSVHA